MKLEKSNLIKLGGAIFLLYLAIYYWQGLAQVALGILGAAKPLFIGFFMAFLVNILMSFYERHYPIKSKKGSRVVSMLLAFLSLFAIVAGLVTLVFPELVASAELLLLEVPRYVESFGAYLEKNISASQWALVESYVGDVDWEKALETAFDFALAGLGGMVGTVTELLSHAVSLVISLVLGLFFAIYMLLGKEKLLGQVSLLSKHYMKKSLYEKLAYIVGVLQKNFSGFIVGQCTEAVILGALCTIGMLLGQFPYANMVGALIGFTALIPIAGAYIGAGVGAFMIFTVSPTKALFFLIFIVILQQIEGNVIYPRVVGASIGLPGIWVLGAITVGGGVMGILGMLLAVPLVACVYQLLKDDIKEAPLRQKSENSQQ